MELKYYKLQSFLKFLGIFLQGYDIILMDILLDDTYC